MVQTANASHPSYVLGHSEEELDRLVRQSRFFDDLTAALLRQAGLREGMRVLDVGCGAGDVSFLAASIVGPRGTVIGVDKSAQAVALASRRTAAGRSNVHFLTEDAARLELDEPVDALVGRIVLMYFADPAAVLRRLATFVKPRGIVVFQELDMKGATSEPVCPTFETAVQRIRETFRRAGSSDRMGLQLPRIFREAGLPAPRTIAGARVEAGPDSPIYEQVAGVTRSLLSPMIAAGVATAEEIAIETLADRIHAEVLALDATLVSPSLIGAWTLVAGSA
jgi:SAM-dependent methyltransferase